MQDGLTTLRSSTYQACEQVGKRVAARTIQFAQLPAVSKTETRSGNPFRRQHSAKISICKVPVVGVEDGDGSVGDAQRIEHAHRLAQLMVRPRDRSHVPSAVFDRALVRDDALRATVDIGGPALVAARAVGRVVDVTTLQHTATSQPGRNETTGALPAAHSAGV